jgi:hypothetical protein
MEVGCAQREAHVAVTRIVHSILHSDCLGMCRQSAITVITPFSRTPDEDVRLISDLCAHGLRLV